MNDLTIKELLKDCLYAFNHIPNKKLPNGETTYELATRIRRTLETLNPPDVKD